MSDHTFNPFIAQKYGINVAILLNNFIFWTRTNASRKKNYHQGRYWCFGTPEYFQSYFPYFTPRQIKYALKKAIDCELLIKGNFNKQGYDRTNWYALSDKTLIELNLDKTCLKPASNLIGQNCPMDKTKLSNRSDKIVPPIPDNKTDNKKITTEDTKSSSFSSLVLREKLSSDKRTNEEFLEHVHHHIDNNSDKNLSIYQRQQGILKLLRKLKTNGEIFCSKGLSLDHTTSDGKIIPPAGVHKDKKTNKFKRSQYRGTERSYIKINRKRLNFLLKPKTQEQCQTIAYLMNNDTLEPTNDECDILAPLIPNQTQICQKPKS